MRKRRDFQIYTGIWIIAVLVLMVLLWQNLGDARIINYSGIVRGATQKLVKEEIAGHPDDALIVRLDNIIYDLQTGQGKFGLAKSRNKDFQRQLADLRVLWQSMKEEIPRLRSGESEPRVLFDLSQRHFELADQMVLCAEQDSDAKLFRSIAFYCFSLLLSISVFAIWNTRSRKALEKSVFTDNLTGILNRAGFEAAAAERLRQHGDSAYTIVELDIDNFKFINNTYGYVFGDRLLCRVADTLTKWRGDDQLCARIDADDFVLLSRQSDSLIGELRELLERMLLDTFKGITFTIGAYQIEHNHELIKTIMDKANTAHKTAKTVAHTNIVWYDEELLRKLQRENEFRERLDRALADGEFKMYLQPKLSLASMAVIGAEALVRWDLPGQGLVYPDSFIPLFEKNGSISKLDFYMLKKTCKYLRDRLDRGCSAITISVNFSRVTLYQSAFYERFLEIVDGFAIPHGCIEVEVTESAFNEVAEAVIQLLFQLKTDGFHISMDDFGSGYSSLNMLNKLPLQIIKMDREFLVEMQHDENVKGVISCAVELSHALGLQIICEGVEEPEHVAFLQKIGCDFGQGYYFSKPIPQEDFSARFWPEAPQLCRAASGGA